jgi:hypothetical protein
MVVSLAREKLQALYAELKNEKDNCSDDNAKRSKDEDCFGYIKK